MKEKGSSLQSEVVKLEKSTQDAEMKLIKEERKYSRLMTQKFVLERADVSISKQELEHLNALAELYRTFDLKLGINVRDIKHNIEEIC